MRVIITHKYTNHLNIFESYNKITYGSYNPLSVQNNVMYSGEFKSMNIVFLIFLADLIYIFEEYLFDKNKKNSKNCNFGQ